MLGLILYRSQFNWSRPSACVDRGSWVDKIDRFSAIIRVSTNGDIELVGN